MYNEHLGGARGLITVQRLWLLLTKPRLSTRGARRSREWRAHISFAVLWTKIRLCIARAEHVRYADTGTMIVTPGQSVTRPINNPTLEPNASRRWWWENLSSGGFHATGGG